ncbi:MAG: hypothetical protein EKK46_04715 [Rhodocyclaceae bacterium]|nr:MAG: hypothetical protein EKK46_04715 [Rhodocyclaceae bacterium]
MLNQSLSPRVTHPTPVEFDFPPLTAIFSCWPVAIPDPATVDYLLADKDAPVDWSEEDIVFLHWRLLQEISRLADPATPLEEKFDTLRWVFSEREKNGMPFSFVNCLRVVGCSPLSPIAYCGLVDVEEVRNRIRHSLKAWFNATLEHYPDWVRDAVVRKPEWIEARLTKNPQWINEQIKRMSMEGDLFA